MDLPDEVRRTLGLALQILEEFPEKLRPYSNIEDMQGLLAGQSSGRDGLIITEAIATALISRTQQIINNPPLNPEDRELFTQVMNERLTEFNALFGLVKQCDAGVFATTYVQTLMRFSFSRRHHDQ